MSSNWPLMALYDNDALVVRYADGSHLELSPCGATMIYEPAKNKGDHPRHGISSRVHKRTCFVTSEHKKLVCEALDFRNRFSSRPYLCGELLNKEDTLTLYACVDSIRWPSTSEAVMLDILEDGRRKITSLDEFATVIVSPHGQDFSITYLSRLSPEGKEKDVNPQLTNSNMSQCFSKDSSKISRKPKEAVIQPYVQQQHLSSSTGSHSSLGTGTCPEMSQEGCLIERRRSGDEGKQTDKPAESEFGRTTANLSYSLHEKWQKSASTRSQQEGEDCNDLNSLRDAIRTLSLSQQQCQGERVVPIDSPIVHDISSISRSSTPDGLRTTIDSDATLINDCNDTIEPSPDSDGQMCHNQKHHRHSSPTHTSSPRDIQHMFVSTGGGQVNQQEIDAEEFYLSNQRQSPIGLESDAVEVTPKANSGVIISSSFHDDNGHPIQNASPSGTEKNELLRKECNPPSSNPSSCSFHPKNNKMSFSNNVVKNVFIQNTDENVKEELVPSVSGSKNFKQFQGMQTLEASTGNRLNICNSTEGLSPRGHEHSPRLLSSVVETESDQQASCRNRYVWLTIHASRNGCPKEWTHPLMLALKGNTGPKTKTKMETPGVQVKDKHTRVSKPLPLSCPFQHTHRVSSHREAEFRSETGGGDFGSTIGEFQQGRLKVVLSEGVIYRLVSSDQLTLVEVYPGDGTVLVSQGPKAIFFTHFIPAGDLLEERTYSLKSLPPGCARGRHSVEKMMRTANRLVLMCLNWDKRCDQKKVPCWQKEIVAVVEPLSTSLLEECYIEQLGRFSAFSNGRVRILFDDRTSLDMVADFNPRLDLLSGDQKDGRSNSKTVRQSISAQDKARVLNSSGNYANVEVNRPGKYAKYLGAAKEWIAWVNSSPAERHKFYQQYNQPRLLQQAAELELKKIFCFNYILEHSALSHQMSSASSSSSSVTENRRGAAVNPHSIRNSTLSEASHLSPALPTTATSSTIQNPFHQTSTSTPKNNNIISNNLSSIHPPNSARTFDRQLPGSFRPHPHYGHNMFTSTPLAPNHSTEPNSGNFPHSFPSDDKCVKTTMGFQSVRSALARTSSLINDIEMFLEENKT